MRKSTARWSAKHVQITGLLRAVPSGQTGAVSPLCSQTERNVIQTVFSFFNIDFPEPLPKRL
jgi:hypothetical protein